MGRACWAAELLRDVSGDLAVHGGDSRRVNALPPSSDAAAHMLLCTSARGHSTPIPRRPYEYPARRRHSDPAPFRQTGLTDVEYEALVDIALGLTDQAIAQRRFLSRRGVTSRLHALYSKLGVEESQLETDAWGQTFSLRILAIRVALQRGLLNRVILEDEATQLEAWLHTYRHEIAT